MNVGVEIEPDGVPALTDSLLPDMALWAMLVEVPVRVGVLIVPAGVILPTPPAGFAVVALTTSPLVGTRAEPPVDVEVMTWVPVVDAVVPPWTL